MVKTWVMEKMRGRALRAATKEVSGFVDGIAAMDDRQIGALVAIATVIRINMETHQVIPEGLFGDGPLPSAEILGIHQMKINKLVRQFVRMGKAADSAGATVWSYSLRCFNIPELRPLGCRLWTELQRGFPHVKDVLKDGEAEKCEALPKRVWVEWDFVPHVILDVPHDLWHITLRKEDI